MLVPTTVNWRGTSGLTFRSVETFKVYLASRVYSDWRPSNICLHATSAPNLAQWDATVKGDDPEADAKQRMLNLTSYYRDEMHWQGGPHLFITDRLICEFNPLTKRGTHSPNFNATHWGIEVVGDFNVEPFDGPRRDLAIGVMAAMCEIRGLDPQRINLHRDDPAGHQACPGKFVSKPDVIQRVQALMKGSDTNGHTVDAPAPEFNSDHIEDLQHDLKNLGFDPGPIDGIPGSRTKSAVKSLYDSL